MSAKDTTDKVSLWEKISTFPHWLSYWAKEVFGFIKQFLQRGWRGWSDYDAWCIDCYLSEILPPMLRRLADTAHGHRIGFEQEEWEELLREMADGFDLVRQVQEHERCFYTEDPDKQKMLQKTSRDMASKGYDFRMFTEEEQKKHDDLFDNLKKHFYDLWD